MSLMSKGHLSPGTPEKEREHADTADCPSCLAAGWQRTLTHSLIGSGQVPAQLPQK